LPQLRAHGLDRRPPRADARHRVPQPGRHLVAAELIALGLAPPRRLDVSDQRSLTSHARTVPSSPPVTSTALSSDRARARTRPSCPLSTRRSAPENRLNARTAPSAPAVKT